jgi:hypothetical protein
MALVRAGRPKLSPLKSLPQFAALDPKHVGQFVKKNITPDFSPRTSAEPLTRKDPNVRGWGCSRRLRSGGTDRGFTCIQFNPHSS